MSGGFFRGTSADQDTRFSNKQAKLLKTQKFPPELEHLVDVSKVKMDVIKPWIATRVTELLGGFEDEVLINFIYGLLEGKEINGKAIQIQLTGFMEKNTSKFMKELWALLLSAQKNASGVPQQFLDAKEEETKKKKAESDRIFSEIQKRKEKESVLEKERKLDGGRGNNSAEDSNRSRERGFDAQPGDANGADVRNGFRERNRSPKSPYSQDHSSSPHRKRSISRSVSPRPRKRSVSPDRIRRTPRRSVSPRRKSARGSISPRRRSPSRRRSLSRTHYGSPSPVRRRFRSPVHRRSPSPGRRRSPPPFRRRSPIRRPSPPRRRRSPSPWRRQSPSPRRRRSPSPRRRRSPSPVRQRRRRSTSTPRSRSPVQQRSRSPVQLKSRSPVQRRSRSPVQQRSQSPVRRRYRSPVRRRSPYLARRRSPSRDSRGSPASRRRRSPLPTRRSPVRAHRRSPTRSPSRSRSLDSRSSASPPRRSSASPIKMQPPRPRSLLHESPRERAWVNDHAEPVMTRRESMAMSPQRDGSDSNRSRRKVPSVSPAPVKSESYSPQIKTRSTSEIRRSASPSQSPKRIGDRRSPDSSLSPAAETKVRRGRHGSPGTSEDDLQNARVDELYKHKSSERRSDRMPSGKNGESPEKPSNLRCDTIVSRQDDTDGPSVQDSPKGLDTGKGPSQRGSVSKEGVATYPGDSSKLDEKKISHLKDARANSRSDALVSSRKKRRSPSVSSDSGSDGSDKPKFEVAEKRKHKRSSRRDAVSDSSSSDSEIENRKDAKRRKKEERKLRKEERRQRREERRRKKEEKRASKRKRKSKNTDGLSSDGEKIVKTGHASNGEQRKYSSEEEETESQKKRLEIELREKALQSLRAKKGMGH